MPKKYNIEQREGETDLQYYHRLAKTADQRLDRLEQLADKGGYFENVEKYAYQKAVRDIQSYPGNEDRKRFNTKPPMAPQLFREKIADMRAFLSSPSSTKAGIVGTYQKRVDTINKKYGTQYSWQQFADFIRSGAAEKLFGEYGSKTTFKAIGKIQAMKDSELKDGIENNLKTQSDLISEQAVQKIAEEIKNIL